MSARNQLRAAVAAKLAVLPSALTAAARERERRFVETLSENELRDLAGELTAIHCIWEESVAAMKTSAVIGLRWRVVWCYYEVRALLTDRPQKETSRDFLRWQAVFEAHSEGRSWKEARKTASERLAYTATASRGRYDRFAVDAAGTPSTMKRSYALIQRILKAG
jgi:hypothetical protein